MKSVMNASHRGTATRRDHPLSVDSQLTPFIGYTMGKVRIVERPDVGEAYTINFMKSIVKFGSITFLFELVASSAHSEHRVNNFPSQVVVLSKKEYSAVEPVVAVKRLVLFKEALSLSAKDVYPSTHLWQPDTGHIANIAVHESKVSNIIMFATDIQAFPCYLADENNQCDCKNVLNILRAYEQERGQNQGTGYLGKSRLDNDSENVLYTLRAKEMEGVRNNGTDNLEEERSDHDSKYVGKTKYCHSRLHVCMFCGQGLIGAKECGALCCHQSQSQQDFFNFSSHEGNNRVYKNMKIRTKNEQRKRGRRPVFLSLFKRRGIVRKEQGAEGNRRANLLRFERQRKDLHLRKKNIKPTEDAQRVRFVRKSQNTNKHNIPEKKATLEPSEVLHGDRFKEFVTPGSRDLCERKIIRIEYSETCCTEPENIPVKEIEREKASEPAKNMSKAQEKIQKNYKEEKKRTLVERAGEKNGLAGVEGMAEEKIPRVAGVDSKSKKNNSKSAEEHFEKYKCVCEKELEGQKSDSITNKFSAVEVILKESQANNQRKIKKNSPNSAQIKDKDIPDTEVRHCIEILPTQSENYRYSLISSDSSISELTSSTPETSNPDVCNYFCTVFDSAKEASLQYLFKASMSSINKSFICLQEIVNVSKDLKMKKEGRFQQSLTVKDGRDICDGNMKNPYLLDNKLLFYQGRKKKSIPKSQNLISNTGTIKHKNISPLISREENVKNAERNGRSCNICALCPCFGKSINSNTKSNYLLFSNRKVYKKKINKERNLVPMRQNIPII